MLLLNPRVRFFFGRIQKRICDLRSFGSWCIKGTDESTLGKDSSVPLMHHDLNDLRSQIHFCILPKKNPPLFEVKFMMMMMMATLFQFKIPSFQSRVHS